jgi:hypothetical protein
MCRRSMSGGWQDLLKPSENHPILGEYITVLKRPQYLNKCEMADTSE